VASSVWGHDDGITARRALAGGGVRHGSHTWQPSMRSWATTLAGTARMLVGVLGFIRWRVELRSGEGKDVI
jgi:hypothetical protein